MPRSDLLTIIPLTGLRMIARDTWFYNDAAPRELPVVPTMETGGTDGTAPAGAA